MTILVSSVNKQDAFNFSSDGNVDEVFFEAAGHHSVSLVLAVSWSSSHIVDGAIEVTGNAHNVNSGLYAPFEDFEISGSDLTKNGNLIEFPATSSADFKAVVTFKNPPKWLILRTQYTTFTSGTVQGHFSWSMA